MARCKRPPDPFRWFDSSPAVIRLVVLMYVRYPLSLRNVEDLHDHDPLVAAAAGGASVLEPGGQGRLRLMPQPGIVRVTGG